MEEQIMREILRQAPFGYAYHKLVLSDDGQPEDYLFLDVNPAFEEMTGLKRQAILGKRVTEILPGIRTSGFDWVAFYGQMTLNGERREITQYAEPLGRWYKITAFTPKAGHVVTVFQEITAEMERIKRLEEQERRIKKLTVELETVFNGTQEAIALIGVENDGFRYIRNNAAHQRLTGYTLEDIKDKTPGEVFGQESGAAIADQFQRCVNAQKPLTYEETLRFPAGERIVVNTLTPVLENGEVKYLVVFRKDITQQKQAEKERDELLERLQAMFNEHIAVMLVIEPMTGKIVDVNAAACNFYGYTRKELLGMYIQDINMLPEDEVAKYRQKALEKKRQHFIFPHCRKNGDIRMVDVYCCPVNKDREVVLLSIIFDVTDREKYRKELYREKELLKITLSSIGDGVVTTDQAGRITALNRVTEEITGWSEQEAKGRPFAEVFKLVSETTGEEVEEPMAEVLQTGGNVGLANCKALVNKQNRQFPIAGSARPIKDDNGRIFGAVIVFRDISQDKAKEEQILYLSYHDQLTGLYNRRFMEEELKRLGASRELPLAVIMGDLNGLKLANDVFGHEAGDKLLAKAAQVIQESCRKEDIIARWGGDEFLILLPRTNAKTAEDIITRIKEACLQVSGQEVKLSIGLGYAVKTKASQSLRRVINEAEEWMYRAKLLEGNSYRNVIISTLLATLFEKSQETEQHGERLQRYCLAVAREMALSIKDQEEMALLAKLHDIGKVAIPEHILKKAGPLTAEEWEEMKKHPAVGYRIAQNSPELAAVAGYILAHHERWDGQGYPRGLKGEEIPLLCRILTVADAYDAMTNDRSYRKAMSREEAMAEIRRNAGTQFDPQVAEIFLRVMGAKETCYAS